jgi:hypothetical protein
LPDVIVANAVRSMFQERESPLLHIRWGTKVYVDVPIGNQPAGASYVDLTDKEITGGRQSNLSLGLNWYLNEKLRLMVNVIKVLDIDRPGSEYDGLDPLIFALRAQWLVY